MRCMISREGGIMNRSYNSMTLRILKMVFVAAPVWIVMDMMAMLLSSVCYAANTIVTQKLFDTVVAVLNGNALINSLIIVAILVTLFKLANQLLNAFCNFTCDPASRTVDRKLKRLIHDKIDRLPALYFEDVEKLECITKAEQGIGICYGVYNCIATLLIFYLPYFIVLGVYLWKLRPILVLSILFIFTPLAITLWVRKNVFTKLIDESVPLLRKWLYYDGELCGKEHYKENRILGTFHYFKNLYIKTFDEYADKKIKANRKVQYIELALRVLTLLGYVGVLALLFDSLLKQYISVGAFAAIFSSIATMISFMNDAVSNYLGGMFDNMGGMNNLINFLDMTEEGGEDNELNFQNDIILEDVSFTYPETDRAIVNRVNLKIHHGETIAIVGENGAGKTTLVKMIMGLYCPTSGTIKVGNINIFNVDKKLRFKKISIVSQQFQKYKMTLAENVSISETEKNDELKIKDSLRISEFDVEKNQDILPEGLDTMLSREFDGVDLSGGQWQRVAIARGDYKDSELIILDEPTSAIDPIEENRLFTNFRKMSEGKTSIIVTHRLASAKIADRIIVLNQGKIVEEGAHADLISKNGIYAMMYNEQTKWYMN